MFNLKKKCESMFGTCDSFYEEVSELSAEYSGKIKSLPSTDELKKFFDCIPKCDEIKVQCEAIENWNFKSTNPVDWIEKYNEFIDSNEPEDDVRTVLNIRKKGEDFVSIYCFDEFEQKFTARGIKNIIDFFGNNINKKGYIRFNVLDKKIELFTKTIAFTNNIDTVWPTEGFDRVKLLECHNQASMFLNRNEVRLIPQDFILRRKNLDENDSIVLIFKKIETILEYIYLANIAHITSNEVVIQFDPIGKKFDFILSEIKFSLIWRQIYEWVFDTKDAVERAAIARSIISNNCKFPEEIANISESVLGSIKSNFVIYQKNSIEKYIDVKKNIADNIIETSIASLLNNAASLQR